MDRTLKEIIDHNNSFVEKGEYEPFITDKYPNKKVAILTCMDTRLEELLPAALGYKNGDMVILKNAGGIVSHPYGSVVRSLIVAIYKLGVNAIWVIGHTDCGMERLDVSTLLDKMIKRGITHETILDIEESGVDYDHWLRGFDSVEQAVLETIEQIKNHPLIPSDIDIEGLIIDSVTGKLDIIKPE